MSYGKIHRELMTSSILRERSLELIGLWGIIISQKNKNGKVEIPIYNLSIMFDTTEDHIQELLDILLSPDPHSKNQAHEGRRLLPLDEPHWYQVVSHAIYARNSPEDERAEAAARKRKERAKKKEALLPLNRSGEDRDMSRDRHGADHIIDVANSSSSSQEPKGSLIKSETDSIKAILFLFETFWKIYPRKVGKKKAATRWKNITSDQRKAALDSIGEHVLIWDRQGRAGDKIPHPTTWLNQERWDDDLSTELRPERNTTTRANQLVGRHDPDHLENDGFDYDDEDDT